MRTSTINNLFVHSVKSKNNPFILIFVTLLFSGVLNSYAQTSIKFAGVDSIIDRARGLVYQTKYFDAIKICEQVIEKYPDNPMGYLGQAAVYHIVTLNYRVSYFDTKFDSITTLTIKIGNEAIKKYQDDEHAYFVLGAAYGFRGLLRIRKGQWFGAFRDGIKGVSNLMKAHEMNKTLYDVYYGLGLYYYWKSAKAKFLTFLRLMKDEREKGIEYLKIATEKGRLSATEAVFALIEIYYYEDRYQEALEAALSLKDEFINDPSWNYLTAKIFIKLKQWEQAKFYFIALLKLLEAAPFTANSYLAECHFGIAECNFELNDFETAKTELRQAFELSQLWDKEKEIEGPLLDFDKVLQRMAELNQKLETMVNYK